MQNTAKRFDLKPTPIVSLNHLGPRLPVEIYEIDVARGWRAHVALMEQIYHKLAFPLRTSLFVPNPSHFNARIIDGNRRCDYAQIGGGSTYVRWWNRPSAGMVLSPGESVLILSADCPTVILEDRQRRRAAVFHAGRDELHPFKMDGKIREKESVVAEAICKLECDPAEVHALICCGIRAAHFTHNRNDPHHGRVIDHFLKTCGKNVLVGDPNDGCLDLTEVIKTQLSIQGVWLQHMHRDQIGTFEDHRFASHRREPNSTMRNAVVVHNVK